MYCGECGAKNSEDSMFCEECGAKLEHEEVKETSKEVVVKTKTKMKLKKPVLVGIIVLVIALATFLYFGKDLIFKETSLDVDWGNTYYLYLKDNISNDTLEEIGLSKDISNSKINFIEVEDIEDPVMIITYEKEDSSYSNIYYISESEVKLDSSNEGDIELLYEIETEEYNYYLHTEKDEGNTYNLIDNVMSDNEDDIYTFTSEDKTTVSSSDEEVTLTKFDETFVEVEVDTSKDFSLDSDIKEIKEVINTSSNSYQSLDEVVTDEVKATVEEKVTEVEETKEKIKEIEEENEKKEKMEVTSSNLQSKLGTQLKWFIAAYAGVIYGWPDIYDYVEITDTSQIKKVCGEEYYMLYKVSGLTSVSSLKTKLQDYVISSKISSFNFDEFTEYSNQVYWCNPGVGDSGEFRTKEASLTSYSDGTAVVKIPYYDFIAASYEGYMSVTLKYQEDSETYKVTEWNRVR